MKNKKVLFLLLLICFLYTIFQNQNLKIDQDLKYAKEYEIGAINIKGEVNILYFESKSKNYLIGANKYGYAVFKNPNLAFDTFKIQYKDTIKKIQKQFKLLPLTKSSYINYKIYGWQSNEDESSLNEEIFVSSFLDIYENSYKK